jgi:hypothetical protein
MRRAAAAPVAFRAGRSRYWLHAGRVLPAAGRRRARHGDKVEDTVRDFYGFPYRGFMLMVCRTPDPGELWRADVIDCRGVFVWMAYGESMPVARQRGEGIVDQTVAAALPGKEAP